MTETIVFRAFAMDLIDGLKLLCVEIGFFLKEITVEMEQLMVDSNESIVHIKRRPWRFQI